MKIYESIKPTDIVNNENTPVGEIGVGTELKGEPIDIDGTVYLETEKGFVAMDALAEVVDAESSEDEDPKAMSSSSKKLIMALVGGGLGFAFAKYKKFSAKQIVIATIGGITAGLVIDYFINKNKK